MVWVVVDKEVIGRCEREDMKKVRTYFEEKYGWYVEFFFLKRYQPFVLTMRCQDEIDKICNYHKVKR